MASVTGRRWRARRCLWCDRPEGTRAGHAPRRPVVQGFHESCRAAARASSVMSGAECSTGLIAALWGIGEREARFVIAHAMRKFKIAWRGDRVCRVCDARGTVGERRGRNARPCPTCKGTGYFPSDQLTRGGEIPPTVAACHARENRSGRQAGAVARPSI